ncbi:MAG TPA: hypothetical protein VI911_01035 [Patescibacteria group bacterium]|nr:hypothetical protein [Patescibacteria group bacterium]
MEKCVECGAPATKNYKLRMEISIDDLREEIAGTVNVCASCYNEAYDSFGHFMADIRKGLKIE